MGNTSYLAVLAASLSLGCAAGSSETVAPSGAAGYSVDCVKASNDSDYCAEEANKRCPSGYNVEEKKEYFQTFANNSGGQQMERWTIVCK